MSDSRFDKVFSDPRFMVAPKKVTKVAIDKRFQKMFKEKDFNVVAKVDKYGKRIDKKDNYALKNYYKGDKSSQSEEDGDDESGEAEKSQSDSQESQDAKPRNGKDVSSDEDAGKKFYDSDGNFQWAGESSSDSDVDGQKDKAKKSKKKAKKEKDEEEDDDAEESEDEVDYDSASYSDELSGVWSLDEEAKQEEEVAETNVEATGKRIAVRKLDWDSISAIDLLALFQSFCTKGGMAVEKVEIYPSKFGKEQMERDILYGPPKDMFK